jgi:hypothetical protein
MICNHRLPPPPPVFCVCACVKTDAFKISCRPTVATRARDAQHFCAVRHLPFVNHRWGGAAVRDAWVTRLNAHAVDSPLLGTHQCRVLVFAFPIKRMLSEDRCACVVAWRLTALLTLRRSQFLFYNHLSHPRAARLGRNSPFTTSAARMIVPLWLAAVLLRVSATSAASSVDTPSHGSAACNSSWLEYNSIQQVYYLVLPSPSHGTTPSGSTFTYTKLRIVGGLEVGSAGLTIDLQDSAFFSSSQSGEGAVPFGYTKGCGSSSLNGRMVSFCRSPEAHGSA